MTIKEHPVETFNDNKIRHAAHSIMELVDNSDLTNWANHAGYKATGFYFIDESEAYVMGPFKGFDKAVEERNKYFENL